MKLDNFFGIKIFLLNVLYKRPKNSTIIYFKNDIVKVKINNDVEIKEISNKLKKVFHESLNVKGLILKKTLVGSDFHYSCDIRNNLNMNIAKKFYKNLFILDNSISTKHKYFPTFQMIYESFYRAKYNLSLKKMIKK